MDAAELSEEEHGPDAEPAGPAHGQGRYSDDESDSDEEQSQCVDSVVRKVVAAYGNEQTRGIAVPDVDLDSLRERLADRLQSCTQACLVCLQRVARAQAVWSCRHCYECYHLVCVQKWAAAAHAKLEADNDNETSTWHCPKCRGSYALDAVPAVYTCFCGSAVNPRPDPWTPAHCCGEQCGRALANCEHTCKLLCHPGPCPACPHIVSTSCHCGRSDKAARRCGDKLWSCNRRCAKTLACGTHTCQLPCHPGDCAPCERSSHRRCRCGARDELVDCVRGSWQCDSVCDKLLPCRRHKCKRVCHGGPCAPCVVPGASACPCGKRTYRVAHTGSMCVDDLPCCGDTCGRRLDCRLHECMQTCHRGDCPPCMVERAVRCRCGAREKQTACSKTYLCDIKCRLRRHCGRHVCNRKCCDGGCPPCEQRCGRQLNCGRHRCEAPCHSGPCYPCPRAVALSCACAGSTVHVACGRARRAKPPPCHRLCAKPTLCHHDTATPHRCHSGACPPCAQVCGKRLHCGHQCAAQCHSHVLVDVNADASRPLRAVRPPVAKRGATSFWDRREAKLEHRCVPCPQCTEPVPVSCLGLHETVDTPCAQARSRQCGRLCGHMLPCGNHSCEKPCHLLSSTATEPTVLDVLGASVEQCDTCVNMCSLPRPAGCTHTCPRRCHPDDCQPCANKALLACHCCMNAIFLPCPSVWRSMSAADREAQRSCGHRCPYSMSCGHQCTRTCHTLTGTESTPESDGVQPSPVVGKKADNVLCDGADGCKKRVMARCPCGARAEKRTCASLKKGTSEPVRCDAACAEARAKTPVNAEPERTVMEESVAKGASTRRRKPPPWHRRIDDSDRRPWYKSAAVVFSIGGGAVVVLAVLLAYFLQRF